MSALRKMVRSALGAGLAGQGLRDRQDEASRDDLARCAGPSVWPLPNWPIGTGPEDLHTLGPLNSLSLSV